MKLKYIFGGLIGSLVLTTTSCSLDYEPIGLYSELTEGSSSSSVAFKDKAAVEAHLKTLYNQMKDRQEHWYNDYLLLAEAHSDNAYGGSTGAEVLPFENNSIDGSNTVLKRDWEKYLEDVGRANKLIVNIDDVVDTKLTITERKQYKAEALIFRSMIFFDMVRIWGDIPLIITVADDITSETINQVYPQYFPKQSKEKEVYEQIEKDLLLALENAPKNDPSNKTLFTKSVTRALLAKIYAEKPIRDYSKVIKYCDELAADGFDLVADFSDLFGMNEDNTDVKARNTKESILEAQFFAGSGNWCTWMFGRDLLNWNNAFTWAKWVTPSRDLIKAFQKENDQKRFKESVVYYKCTWSTYYPADNYPFMYKCRSSSSSIIKFRYADILLLKAEALIMKDSPNLTAAADIIDKVRQRAGISPLDASTKGSKVRMKEAVLNERRLELAFEGQRWYDLVRLEEMDKVMNAVYAKDAGRRPQAYPYSNDRSFRLPVPQAILDQNPNLVQNFGY